MNQVGTVIVDSPVVESVVDAAIARVIDAEREAQQSIIDAETEAAATIERARVAVRALDERTEHRVRAVRAAFEQRTSIAVAALDREGKAVDAGRALTEADLTLVQAAVDALARSLTEGAL